MNEDINNIEEPSASSELSNMGRKTVGVAQNIGNLALGMGQGFKEGFKNGLKDKNDEGKKPTQKVDGLPKKDSLDSKSLTKKGADIAKEGAKKVGSGIKKLWMLIPPPWNYIILGFILILLLVLFLIIGLGGSSDDCEYEDGVAYEYSCTSINVQGVGAVPLEDYVAGVVSGESYPDQNIEAIKAQAVAARTYALYVTNDCKTSIKNSQANQVYNGNYRQDAIEAVEATEGEVLIYDGKIFASEYDSFNIAHGKCAGSTCTLTYTKLPNSETHKVTLGSAYYGMVAGGHGRGMSQVVSYQMANEGSTYEEILEYFYSDGVQIANHTSEKCEGEYDGDFAPRTNETGSIYNDPDALEDIRKAAPNVYNLLYISGLKYQCVTYARLRAVEILLTTNVYDEATRNKAISIINSNSGNGWAWYPGGIPALGAFNYDSTCTEFKPGSLIAFKGSGARCTNSYNGSGYCGHVAIVEEVDDDGNIRITDGYSSLKGEYHELWLTPSTVKSKYGGCIATTYLLEYNG